MTILAIAAIVAVIAWVVAYTVHEFRAATRPDETDWIAPHAGWIEQQELDRLVNAIVDDAHQAYDAYRGEVR